MSNLSHVVLVALAATTFVGGTGAVTAQAASHVKVVSTKKVHKVAYHATKGNLYSSAKLTHVKYHIKNYPHTTWYSFKKATVKKNGKKVSYTYIKAGKKAGWLYSKDLIKGKAAKKAAAKKVGTTVKKATPAKKTISKKQRFKNDLIAVENAYRLADSDSNASFQSSYQIYSGTYSDIGSAITYSFEGDNGSGVTRVTKDKAALLQIYQIFKGRFNASQNASLNSMSDTLSQATVTKDTSGAVGQQIITFAAALSQALDAL